MWYIIPLLLPLVLRCSGLFGNDPIETLVTKLNNEPIPVLIDLKYGDYGFNFPDLVEASQIQLNHILPHSRFKYILIDNLQLNSSNLNSLTNQFSVELHLANEVAVVIEDKAPKILVVYSLATIHANDLPFFIAQAIVDHLVVSDLVDYNLTKSSTHVNLKVLQVKNNHTTIYKGIGSDCKNYLSNHSYDFLDFHIDYFTVDMEDIPLEVAVNEIYLDLNNASLALHSEHVLQLGADSQPPYSAICDHIYYKLDQLLELAPYPLNNINVRLGSLLKHLVIQKLQRLGNFLLNESSVKYRDQRNQFKLFMEHLYLPPQDWMGLYTNISGVVDSTNIATN